MRDAVKSREKGGGGSAAQARFGREDVEGGLPAYGLQAGLERPCPPSSRMPCPE